MKLFKKIFKLNRPFTTVERVDLAKGKVIQALESFVVAHESIVEANAELEKAIHEDTQKIMEIERNRDRASDELSANKKLQEQLAKFLP